MGFLFIDASGTQIVATSTGITSITINYTNQETKGENMNFTKH